MITRYTAVVRTLSSSRSNFKRNFQKKEIATGSPNSSVSFLIFQALVFFSLHQKSNKCVRETFARCTGATRKFLAAIWRAAPADKTVRLLQQLDFFLRKNRWPASSHDSWLRVSVEQRVDQDRMWMWWRPIQHWANQSKKWRRCG